MSELVQQSMTEREARRLTERIRLTALNYTEAKAKLLELVQEAKDGNAHEALGYKSWTAYLAETLGDEPMRLARDERQEMVRVLSSEGMSTRAIAPIVGTGQTQVRRDLDEVSHKGSPAPPADDVPTAHRTFTDEPGRIQQVTGMDGKTYARPEPKEAPKPKRRPLKDSVDDAGWNLTRAIERLNRVAEDDRFDSQKDEMATHLRGHLTNAVKACQDLLDRINPEGNI